MIKIKLKDVLTKKNISANELSHRTGISRTSLTPLINGTSKMIKFDTLNKIVYALKVGLGEIIDYIPDTNIQISNLKIDYENKKIEFLFESINEVSKATRTVSQTANYSVTTNGLSFDMFKNSTDEELNIVWDAVFDVAESTGYFDSNSALAPLFNVNKTKEFLSSATTQFQKNPPHSEEDKSFKDMSVFSQVSYQIGNEMDDAFFPYEVIFLTAFLEKAAQDHVLRHIEKAGFTFSAMGFSIFNWFINGDSISTQIRNASVINYEVHSRTDNNSDE